MTKNVPDYQKPFSKTDKTRKLFYIPWRYGGNKFLMLLTISNTLSWTTTCIFEKGWGGSLSQKQNRGGGEVFTQIKA